MNTSNYQNELEIVGDSAKDTKLLRAMASEAREYLSKFDWCPPIKAIYLGDGVGGIVAVFLVELARKIGSQDRFLWVIVGDLPSAYLVVDNSKTPKEALHSYCEIMDEWIAAVMSGKGIEDVYPVAVQATQENAQKLATRLRLLRENVIPTFANL